MPAASSVHEFGLFRLDSAERLLLRDGQPVSLTPKAFDLLVYLVDHAGRLVTKQALMSELWPNSFVEESNLTFTVSALRKALGDGQDGEQFIQTVPTRGYRFVAPVTREGNPSISSTSGKPPGSIPALVRRIAMAALAVATLATVAVLVRRSPEPAGPLAHHRYTIPMPDAAVDAPPEARIPVAQISPDGKRVAFIVRAVTARLASRIWLQRLDELHADEVTGTEGALSLFWAPDSQQLGFFTLGAVKKLTVSNGTVQTLCEPCEPAAYGSGTWSRSGLILFPSRDGRLLGLREGGAPEAITSVNQSRGELRHMAPRFLPDGQRFLYMIRNTDASRSGLYVGQVGSTEPKLLLLLQSEQPAIHAAPGYLLFDRAGSLVARPFDLARLEFTGDPMPLFPLDRRSGPTPVSVSDTGVLTHDIVAFPRMQFQWVRRTTGEGQQLVMEPGDYRSFDLSPDEKQLAFTKSAARSTSVWVHDLEKGSTVPWTFGDSAYTDPRWTNDSQRLLATRWQPEPMAIVQISPDGSQSVVSTPVTALDDVSLDGKYLLYRYRELRAQPLGEGTQATVVRKAPSGFMDQAQFSPDTRWIAYHADETGRFEVYVTPFPSGEREPISSGGAVQPMWRRDGRELYYLGLNGMLHAVEVRPDGKRLHFTDRQLFQTGIVPSKSIEQYAPSADGQSFLILKPVDNKVRSSIGVIYDWPALLTAGRSR
jgi:DNA-binding winged helix-turn-helix (wHTH) protein